MAATNLQNGIMLRGSFSYWQPSYWSSVALVENSKDQPVKCISKKQRIFDQLKEDEKERRLMQKVDDKPSYNYSHPKKFILNRYMRETLMHPKKYFLNRYLNDDNCFPNNDSIDKLEADGTLQPEFIQPSNSGVMRKRTREEWPESSEYSVKLIKTE